MMQNITCERKDWANDQNQEPVEKDICRCSPYLARAINDEYYGEDEKNRQ